MVQRNLQHPEKKPYRMAKTISDPLLVAPNIANIRQPAIAVMGMTTGRQEPFCQNITAGELESATHH